MNKTVNINLGGMFFHIDEDAYQKLTRYFTAIKRSLTNATGQDEIIKDIEMRIAEIISEKHANDKQVINMRQVDEVIAIMGQPEDYRIEDDGAPEPVASFDTEKKRMKKLYRDGEKGMIGGVATGLGHYTGIDAVWIKILFIVITIASFGTGVLVYLILWIVTPAAFTTAEKLEMKGEPVNISNIERKVREEFENVSDKFKNADYKNVGKQVKTGADRAADNVLDFLGVIFKVFAKVLGAFIVVFSAIFLATGVIGLVTLGSSTLVDVPWLPYADAFNYTDVPLWLVGILAFLAVGIPLFFLFILGLKLLVTNLKSIGSVAKYTLLALWLLSVGTAIVLIAKQATEIGYDGKTVEKQLLPIAQNDTLYVKFRFNDYFEKDVYHHNEFRFVQDEKGKDMIYSNEVHIEFLPTDEKQAYIQIEKTARGRSLTEAKKRSEKINYAFKFEGKQLILDNYFLTELDNKFRGQEISIYVYVPNGMYIKPDKSVENYDWSNDEFFNLHYSGEYDYKVDGDKVKCLNCPADENEYDDVEYDEEENDTIKGGWVIQDKQDSTKTITIDQKGVRIQNGKNTESGKLKSLKVDENGIIIKTE